MQDQSDKYWEIKQWSKTNFDLIYSFSKDNSSVINELKKDFDDHAKKEAVVFSLSGKIPNQDLVISKSIYLAHYLIQYCNVVEKDDIETLSWIKQKYEEIKKQPSFSLKEDAKKFMRSSIPYGVFIFLIIMWAFQNAFENEKRRNNLPSDQSDPNFLKHLIVTFAAAYKFSDLISEATSKLSIFQGEPHYTFYRVFKKSDPDLKTIFTLLENKISEKEKLINNKPRANIKQKSD